MVCEPRRQGPYKRGDDLVGLGPRAWSPPLPRVGRGADGAGVEKRGLQACSKTGERLLGIRLTGKRGSTQRLDGAAFLVTLLAPLRIDRALGLRLAMVRVEEDPALRAPAITRGHDRLAITIGQRGHGRRLRLGEDLLRLGQGRGAPRDPLEAGMGQLVPILGVIESAVGDKIRWALSGWELGNVVTADLTEHFAITPIATQGLHQQRDTGLMLHDQCQHHVVEGRAMIPTLAWGHGHDLFVGGRIAVRAAIDMDTRRIEMGERWRQPQTRGRRGGNEAIECGQPSLV